MKSLDKIPFDKIYVGMKVCTKEGIGRGKVVFASHLYPTFNMLDKYLGFGPSEKAVCINWDNGSFSVISYQDASCVFFAE